MLNKTTWKNEDNVKLIEEWYDVLEMNGEWKTKCAGADKIDPMNYAIAANILESSIGGDITGYNKVLVPMLRRGIAQNIALQGVAGIQPMTAPTGLIFHSYETYQNDSVNVTKRPASDSIIATLADATLFVIGTAISSTADAYVGVIRHKEGNNVLIDTTSGTLVAAVDVDDVASFVASVTTVSAVYNNEVGFDIFFSNYGGPVTTAVGEALTTDMRTLGLQVSSTTVTAKSRKLKVEYSDEAAEDMMALGQGDLSSWLQEAAVRTSVLGVNREVLALIDTASTSGGSATFNFESPAEGVDGRGRWENEIYNNLKNLINRTKMAIAQTNKKGAGNYCIVSPNVLAAMQNTGLVSDGLDISRSPYQGMYSGMKVYVDIRATSDFINIGYKGADESDAGVYYAPYKPLTVQKLVAEDSGQPKMIFRSRYGTASNPYGAASYFRKIVVTNIPTA